MTSQAASADGGQTVDRARVRVVAITLILVGSLCLFVANLLVWVNTSLLDSSEFTSTVSDVMDQPDVQARLAEVLAAQVLQSNELQTRIDEELPDRLEFLAPVIRAQLQPVLEQLAQRILASDFLGDARDQLVANLYQRVLDLLENRTERLKVEGDAIVWDLSGPLQRLDERLNLTGGEQQGGSSDNRGQIVLTSNVSGLKQASWFVRNRTEIVAALLAVTAVAFVGAVLIRRQRRRALEVAGYGILSVGLVTIVILFISNQVLESQASEHLVLRELVRGLESNLRWQSLALTLLGLCIVLFSNDRVRGWLPSIETRTGDAVQAVSAPRVAILGLAAVAGGLLLFGT